MDYCVPASIFEAFANPRDTSCAQEHFCLRETNFLAVPNDPICVLHPMYTFYFHRTYPSYHGGCARTPCSERVGVCIYGTRIRVCSSWETTLWPLASPRCEVHIDFTVTSRRRESFFTTRAADRYPVVVFFTTRGADRHSLNTSWTQLWSEAKWWARDWEWELSKLIGVILRS